MKIRLLNRGTLLAAGVVVLAIALTGCSESPAGDGEFGFRRRGERCGLRSDG